MHLRVRRDCDNSVVRHGYEGETLLGRGRPADALQAFRAALEVDPASASAHAGAGAALFDLERYEEALQSLRKAVVLQPDPPMAAVLHRLIGRAAQELGHPDADDHYARAIELDPRDARAIDRLAMARFRERR